MALRVLLASLALAFTLALTPSIPAAGAAAGTGFVVAHGCTPDQFVLAGAEAASGTWAFQFQVYLSDCLQLTGDTLLGPFAPGVGGCVKGLTWELCLASPRPAAGATGTTYALTMCHHPPPPFPEPCGVGEVTLAP